MTVDDELKAQAKRVATDIKAEKASAGTGRAREFMAENPDAVVGAFEFAVAEDNRENPDEALIQAYLYLFSSGLVEIRYEIERGQDWAETFVDAVREALLGLARDGVIAPRLLMLFLNGFIEAKLAPGDALTELLGDIAHDSSEDQPALELPEVEEIYESIVAQASGNEFEVHDAFDEIGKAMPPEFRQALLHQITASENPVIRDAAVFYLLDAAPEVRRTASQLIAQQTPPTLVSSETLRRMIALRNWLPEGERPPLDAAIKKTRQRRVDCAPWPKRLVQETVVSNIDGAGAQSVFAVTKEGRKFVIASLLVKQGVGIADAWCLRGQSKSEVRQFLRHIRSETDSHPTDLKFLDVLVPHYLAVGQRNGAVPVAGFLDFIETIGMESWQPSEFTADNLVSFLEQGIDPARIDPATVAKVVETSRRWLDRIGFLDSWFEGDAEVNTILSRTAESKTPAKMDAIVESVLEPRRAKWTERFLWTALWLKEDKNSLSPWEDFFVIGRELHRGRAVKDIPIMQGVAEATVLAAMPRL
jgi:hypothetical protein